MLLDVVVVVVLRWKLNQSSSSAAAGSETHQDWMIRLGEVALRLKPRGWLTLLLDSMVRWKLPEG